MDLLKILVSLFVLHLKYNCAQEMVKVRMEKDMAKQLFRLLKMSIRREEAAKERKCWESLYVHTGSFIYSN